MDPNPKRRDQKRSRNLSTLTKENLKKGIYSRAKMYNCSKDGLYFESNLVLQIGEKVFIGIENSPYFIESGVYGCYYGVIVRRKEAASLIYEYGYDVKHYDSAKPQVAETDDPGPPEAQPAERDVIVQKDRRKHQRRSLSKTATCFAKNGIINGRITDFGPSGAFIETKEQFQVGQKFTIALPFVNKGRGAMAKAEVMWKDEEGVGVKFKRPKKQKS